MALPPFPRCVSASGSERSDTCGQVFSSDCAPQNASPGGPETDWASMADDGERPTESSLRGRGCRPAASLLLDECACIYWSSPAAAVILGRVHAEICGQPIAALLPELPLRADTPGYNAAYVAFWYASGRPLPCSAFDAQGKPLSLEISIDTVRLGDRLFHVVTLQRECGQPSEHAQLQRCLEAAERSRAAVAITDRRGVVSYINPSFAALTGWTPAEVLGRFIYLVTGCDPASRVRFARLREAPAGESHGHFVGCRRDGTEFHAHESVRPFVNTYGRVTHHVFTLRDTGVRVQAGQDLAHLAHHDALTGLPNRTLFADRMQREIAHCNRNGSGFALLWLDLDQFKSVNDRLGHAAGDELLRALAPRLQTSLREEDTVARLGGDEFAVILTHASHCADLEVAIAAIDHAITHSVLVEGEYVTVSASIGIARFPIDGREEATLLRAADRAMYRAKRAGGRRHCFAGSAIERLNSTADAERMQPLSPPEEPE